jgi:hypothetical protein
MVHEAGGCWMYFDKLAPLEEEDPKKKAAAKGKALVEEIKPAFGKAWINLKSLQNIGVTEFEQRFLIQTCNSKGETEDVE